MSSSDHLLIVLYTRLVQGLLNPKAMARLSLGEALTNLVWAKVDSYYPTLTVFWLHWLKYSPGFQGQAAVYLKC